MTVPRERLTAAAQRIPQVVETALQWLDHLRRVIDFEKRKGICTGTVYWRRDGGNPKLYVNHGIDQACPIHGEPAPGKRLRVYVGTDPARQQRAKEAIERAADVAALTAEAERLSEYLNQDTWALRAIVQRLEIRTTHW